MYAVFVVLPLLQKEFGVTRAEASIPWLLTTLGFGFGGILVGKIADRRGVFLPELSGVVFLAAGFIAAAQAQTLWQFALIQGIAIAMLGSAASFAPLIGDISHWFSKRRGMAMSICVSGNLAAGAVWPPILQYFFDRVGWRATFVGTGIACLILMLPLVLMLRKKSPVGESVQYASGSSQEERPLGFRPPVFQAILAFAGFCCCLAMAVPQVHIVAYCGDLGYGALRGAQMLSLMLGAGIVSRVLMGWMSDTIGGLRTVLIGSALQCASLAFFMPFDSVGSLYVLSILFGFFGGGIVPAYTLIVREYFSPAQAGSRIGVILMTAQLGMGLGGWLGGWFFDATGSYRSAFAFGVGANLVNIAIILWLMARAGIHFRADLLQALRPKRVAKA
jgi:MFS family permease